MGLLSPWLLSWIWSWIRIWKEGSRCCPWILSSWIWWIWPWIWIWIPWLSSIYLLVSQNFVAFIGICWNLLPRNTDLYLKKKKKKNSAFVPPLKKKKKKKKKKK